MDEHGVNLDIFWISITFHETYDALPDVNHFRSWKISRRQEFNHINMCPEISYLMSS